MRPPWIMLGMTNKNDSSNFENSDDKNYFLDNMSIQNATIENDSKYRTVREYLDDHDESSGLIMSDDDLCADIGDTIYTYDNGMKIEADKDSAFIDSVKMIQRPYV